ncbi:MAG: four helix bundle protein [Planctomycetaceae bacterium]|nr:four helix bundle protein [Planctomycetaceae bacterium]
MAVRFGSKGRSSRFTQRDRCSFFGIARGSAQECLPLLKLARRRHLLTNSEHLDLNTRLEKVARMPSG